jgi:hypothetical protein
MKKILTGVLLLLSFQSEALAKKWKLIEPVGAGYYDKKAESMFVPLRSCDYVVDFEFYGRPIKLAGQKRKVRRKLKSNMPKIHMKKMVYHQKEHYDGFHEEEYFKYFLAQVASDGYMQINYLFTDRMGNIMERSEKVYKPKYHQKFPSRRVVPRQCNRDGRSRTMRSFRD